MYMCFRKGPMIPIMRVPVEILMMIAEQCNPATLAVMARVNSSLQRIVENNLYREINDKHLDHGQLIYVFHSIVTCPRFQPMVRAIIISREPPCFVRTWPRPYLTLLARTLRMTRKITMLQVPNSIPPGKIFAGCTFRLKGFIGPDWITLYNVDLDRDGRSTPWIATQADLAFVGLRGDWTMEWLHEWLPQPRPRYRIGVPKLRVLVINAVGAVFLLGRNWSSVKYLTIEAQNGLSLGFLSLLPTGWNASASESEREGGDDNDGGPPAVVSLRIVLGGQTYQKMDRLQRLVPLVVALTSLKCLWVDGVATSGCMADIKSVSEFFSSSF